jgi:hypothetical protein
MRKLVIGLFITLFGIIFAGCGITAKEIQARSQSEKTNIFTEVSDGGTIPKGFAELTIKANIKTHIEGYYILESKESLHGKQKYPFLLNIGGQAALWKVDGIKDSRPAYEGDGKASHDPEAREGMKYTLEKRVRLAAGTHKVLLGFPEENFFSEVEVTLTEGGENILEFKPVYRYKTHPTRIPTFLRGIKEYEVSLNGNKIR